VRGVKSYADLRVSSVARWENEGGVGNTMGVGDIYSRGIKKIRGKDGGVLTLYKNLPHLFLFEKEQDRGRRVYKESDWRTTGEWCNGGTSFLQEDTGFWGDKKKNKERTGNREEVLGDKSGGRQLVGVKKNSLLTRL